MSQVQQCMLAPLCVNPSITIFVLKQVDVEIDFESTQYGTHTHCSGNILCNELTNMLMCMFVSVN